MQRRDAMMPRDQYVQQGGRNILTGERQCLSRPAGATRRTAEASRHFTLVRHLWCTQPSPEPPPRMTVGCVRVTAGQLAHGQAKGYV